MFKTNIKEEVFIIENDEMNDVELRNSNTVDNYERDTAVEDALIDKTVYGEFVSTFHGWVSFEDQNRRAKLIENITKGKK